MATNLHIEKVYGGLGLKLTENCLKDPGFYDKRLIDYAMYHSLLLFLVSWTVFSSHQEV